ncbi:MAG: hypothetical protein OQJ93_08910 [Ignavibacteriaceae bacterium]|nr:hypothetical protein [Ignavibacteriaceae bacterium]MCW8812322.1 hypothetical protein [Chlorobium sp.]MCW8818570.1 hypothetical protein [Ignavibacteriaceae bacterium]MCW9095069.1 hypothetical protein [Ignavibacteriaceae bacterium]MCW9097496.1 hypothetical protein [Ignavibacteriaceae bacterium]
MKTILQVVLFLSILIINVESYPQLINNFSDFPWKSSKENVMSLMHGLDFVKLNSEGGDFIVFENGIFGDFPVKYWDYRFYNDSLYSVIIVIDSTTIYDTLKIENLKNFVRQQHIVPFGNSVLKLDYNWLLSDVSGNLIGIIDIESNPTLTFGNRIRVVFRYYPL